MKKTSARNPTVLFCSASLGLAALLAAPVAATATPAQPAELQALEQKMSELPVNSERFTANIAVTGRSLPHALAPLRKLSVSLSGEASTTPAQAVVSATVLGKTITVREVEGVAYLDSPALGARDGGRPWVMEGSEDMAKLFAGNPGIGAGSSTPFKSTATLLRSGRDVRALGPSTIDGQAVSGFAADIDALKLEEGQVPAKLRAEARKLHLRRTAAVQEFINAEGLPVRTSLILHLGPVRMTISADVVAINFPLSVAAPAAAETISLSEAESLTKKK
jgi:hypothetical protein